MKCQLTYADRESLLTTFHSLKNMSSETDEQLLESVSQWAKMIEPHFGFELSLIRDVTALSRYMTRQRMDQDIVDISRGALLYTRQPNQSKTAKLGEFSLLDDAFVCSYAVHEIRTRLGEPATYSPPRLTKAEQKSAETLFLQFIDESALDDAALIEISQRIATGLANLSVCGLFKRFHKNIDFLISVLVDSDRSHEQKCYARAALNYLVCEEDAIDDRLGIVGYIDDNFIVQLAVDFIEPNREPWLDLLDDIVSEWPFLNGLIIDDGSGGRPISEYMMINSAVSCTKLHGKDLPPSILLVTPFVGPAPFLLGFMSTVGLIHESGKQEVTEQSFVPGQKVLVDNCSIREFTGFEYINERKMFGLKKHITHHRRREDEIRWWPASELYRLAPAVQSLTTRGEVTYDLSHSDTPIPALDYLFSTDTKTRVSGVEKRVITVMPVVMAHYMANRLGLYGHAMKDAVPMGHLSVAERVEPWSNRFGLQEPLLIFVSDADVACAFVEDSPDDYHVVIVDTTGRNANKTASLRRLQQFKIPTLIVSSERAAYGLNLIDDERVGVWEWNDDDFSALLWPVQHTKDYAGPLVKYERRLQLRSPLLPEIKKIPFRPGKEAFESARQVQACARRRGGEQLAELDDILVLIYRIMSRLLRSAVPVTKYALFVKQIEADFKELNSIRQRSRYLSREEQVAISEAEETLLKLLAELQRDNPKANTLLEMLVAEPSLAIICPDARLRPDLEEAYLDLGTRVLASYDDEDGDLKGAIVPGWFRNDRMATLLMPPVTKPLYLVLYDVEHKWYVKFQRDRRKARQARSARCSRSKLFPGVKGWRKPKQEPSKLTDAGPDSGLQDLEEIQEHSYSIYRQRVYKAAKSDGSEAEVLAQLVIFEGGLYAFLTELYNANVVTHLIDASIGDPDDEADVKQKRITQLKLGDALLFHRGSDRDVIRVAADKILAPGIRGTSSLWRTAMSNYVTSKKLTSEEFWKRLRDVGCPLKHQTIKIWLENDNMIAPQAYNRDVRLIAIVTGDVTLSKRIEDVIRAIHMARSAHLRVSKQLAKQVLSRAIDILKQEDSQSPLVEIESNVVVVRVIDIDDQAILVRASLTNRLLEGEQWHE